MVVHYTLETTLTVQQANPPTIPKQPLQSYMAPFQGKAIEPCQGSLSMKVRNYVGNPHVCPQCLAPPQSKMPCPCSLLLQQLTLFMPAHKLLFPSNVGHGNEGLPPLSTKITPRASTRWVAPNHCPHLVQQWLPLLNLDKMYNSPQLSRSYNAGGLPSTIHVLLYKPCRRRP